MSNLQLPPAPAALPGPVKAWSQPVTIPTYAPLPADRNPMFLERRVYQGSSGKVYPLPFTDRIAEEKHDQSWDAVHLENEFLRVMILPQIGGRIHVLLDKTNGYDLIYRQNVIKPALVGLAGPWISGGIEFNWPQHHRPSTFMPAEVHIEEHPDGSRTVWLSEHDPMSRMKGMHGVCLHPGKAYLELKVRLYNRTPLPQTFLWWANLAARVHDQYQSFFPPDVHYVADHAKRAISAFPLCQDHYYGINYAARAKQGIPPAETPSQFPPRNHPIENRKSKIENSSPLNSSPFSLSYTGCHAFTLYSEEKHASATPAPTTNPPIISAPNDLSWYANIPVPTSYMALGSQENFFGGYDHARRAGFVHIANHHIAPGKKQWTWGNHAFGYAWDRHLTDTDGPYIELMAGVFTDNQPDFSFLQPGETKSFTQFWYPIQEIGPAHHANLQAALSLQTDSTTARIGISVTSLIEGAQIVLESNNRMLAQFTRDLAPGQPLLETVPLAKKTPLEKLRLTLRDAKGNEIIAYQPQKTAPAPIPPPAQEPPPPAKIPTVEELYLAGLHLQQYRHATRCPTLYWREALRRDPADARTNNALGQHHLRRGELPQAEAHFRSAIARLTQRNPNPYDGEPHYNLGLCLRFQRRYEEAYDAFYKSAWNAACQPAAYHTLAELDCRRKDWPAALDHLDRALRLNADNLRARNLKTLVLRQLARYEDAQTLLQETLALDPLDPWARQLSAGSLGCTDPQLALDIALDLSRASFYQDALDFLVTVPPTPGNGVTPLLHYYRAYCADQLGDKSLAKKFRHLAAQADPAYCFPARLEEIFLLQHALAANPRDAHSPYYLGNLLYDRRRHHEAIRLWRLAIARAALRDPALSILWRNLGLASFNILHQPAQARRAYEKALRAAPRDARLLYERDQLWKRLAISPTKRLAELERRPALVAQRDDLSVELCALHNQTAQPHKALAILSTRRFQPWEGGEGLALTQHVRTHLALGRSALAAADAPTARHHFTAALHCPENLGEARHLLANPSDIHYYLGLACAAGHDRPAARLHWRRAAAFQGDFQNMTVQPFSEMTYFQALALRQLGRKAQATKLLRALLAFARKLARTPATIDYFATSLPTMLIFEDDLSARQKTTAQLLQAQVHLALNRPAPARRLLTRILRQDPSHPLAHDLLTQTPNPLS